jgi:hypothetical protein
MLARTHASCGPNHAALTTLVLDVGRSWRNTVRADTGNIICDRVRPLAALGPLLGRLKRVEDFRSSTAVNEERRLWTSRARPRGHSTYILNRAVTA